jgi:hypothetical protein
MDEFAAHAAREGGQYSEWSNADGTGSRGSGRKFAVLEKWDSDLDADGIQPGLFGAPDQPPITLENAQENLLSFKTRKMDKLNIIVGCVEFHNPSTQSIDLVNIADIPISLAKWNEWFVLSVMQPAITSMSLSQFIKKTMRSLVFDVLGNGECHQGDTPRQMWDMGITNFTLPAYFDGEKYMNPAEFLTNEDFLRGDPEDGNMRFDLEKIHNKLNEAGNKTSLFNVTQDNTEVYHFIALYARGYETSTLLGFETQMEADDMAESGDLPEYLQDVELKGDIERGIFHFHLGHNQGLLKSVKFNRTDTQYLAEARMQANGAFGYNQLRGRYEATVTLQGNTFFLPGQMIYINPRSVGSGDLDSEYEDTALLLGLGGYYMVQNVESVITPEFFETTLKCVWTNYGKAEICNRSTTEGEFGGGAVFSVSDATAFAETL